MEIFKVKKDGLLSAKHHFHPSIFSKSNKLFIAYRTNNSKKDPRLAINQIEKKNNSYITKSNPIELQFENYHLPDLNLYEDPRVFYFNNDYYCAVTCIWKHCQSQAIVKLPTDFDTTNPDSIFFSAPIFIPFGKNINGSNQYNLNRISPTKLQIITSFPESYEKNWQFFEHENHLHFIYWANVEHIVVKLDDQFKPINVQLTDNNTTWAYGEIRGGTPPLPFDEKHNITFFHSTMIIAPEVRAKKFKASGILYMFGAYLFEKEAPFKIKWITHRPLLTGDLDKPSDIWDHASVYPCGSLRRGDNWLVSYGDNEHNCKIAVFSHQELKNEFKKVK